MSSVGFPTLLFALTVIVFAFVVATSILISGVLCQRKRGLPFNQQIRFGHFLGALISTLLSILVIQPVANSALCQSLGSVLFHAETPGSSCEQLRYWLDMNHLIWIGIILASGILVGILWPNVQSLFKLKKTKARAS